ncbi:helix-turn-helix transcriptional regulator [Actinomadura decatromicini]|uniref:Helix-turn-helix transcriptional regulator n=1 Tax=Actinomadura decatromicini TaxID=2604572 RepID=A0A5D3FCR7_9ACTN|nr:helix-turn-helix transcriptional regulator [Actinomadura decatromicini]TYK46707.1 helix-turn-helix transcriptional regulator [Actinomadura decatromicini]
MSRGERSSIEAASDVGTTVELGAVISHWVGRVVPHEGYMLAGVDPVTGVGCFLAREDGYSQAAARRLIVGDRIDGDHPYPFERRTRQSRVGVFNTDAPGLRRNEAMRDVMLDQGVGSELRIALAHAGTMWGGLVLLRPRGARPFSVDESVQAQRLARDVVAAMRRYAAGAPPEPRGLDLPPGVLVIGTGAGAIAAETVVAATPSARGWLDELGALPADAPTAPNPPVESIVWILTQTVRTTDKPAMTRVPTRRGWIVLHAQPLIGGTEVAVTIQPAVGTDLLPAMAFWHGLTPKERAVVEQVLDGLAAKQIARRLEMSPHTLNDHFKSIYRKLGVSAREELIARLIR